jgi:uncharacterized protein YkwD
MSARPWQQRRDRRLTLVALVVLVPLLLAALAVGTAHTAHAGTGDTIDGQYSKTGIRPAGGVLRLTVAGRGGTPANAAAAALNITATQSASSGFATVYPCGTKRPQASTINFTPGTTIANGVITKIGTSGQVCIYTHQPTHLIVDVAGFFPPGTDYRALNPARLLDTRKEDPPASPSAQAAAHSLYLLNQLRAANGVGPLAMDAGMSDYALSWSANMARNGFRHSGGPYAENIAWHSLASMSPVEAATTIHNMWVGSSGHLRNMVDGRWTRVGIGLHVDSSGWWGTHEFS